MLKSLKISNFRCYTESTVYFNGSSIIVGKNNAGKSTLIEALKIISSVSRKYKSLRFQAPPEWVPYERNFGVCPNVENMNISDRGIFNMYGDPPAVIEASFENGTSVKAYVGEELSIFALIIDEDGDVINRSADAKYVDIPLIEVLPQISAVLDNEKVIKKNTVDSNRSTRLASRNFRNQLYYYSDSFPRFKSLVESTWDTLRVSPIETSYIDGSMQLQFYVRVNGFEAEISWMGHGLQMWIQTMWFISQCPNEAIVVLDEPDVYMHADLQRRLVRLISPKFSQLIIATHSLEIIEEVPSDSIIPIDASKRHIQPLGEEASLQSLTENLGSPLNIDLARLFVSHRFMIFNGSETGRKILSAFQSILFPDDLHPIITFPKVYVKGGYEWAKVRTIMEVFSSNEMPLMTYCILESGVVSPDEIDYINANAEEVGINLHSWKMIEAENYAINPEVIYRYVKHNKRRGDITLEQINDIVEKLVEQSRNNAINDFVDILCQSEGVSETVAKNRVIKIIESRWKGDYDFVYGHQFFKELSNWTKVNFGIHVSSYQIAGYFRPHEIPFEMKSVISNIVNGDTMQ